MFYKAPAELENKQNQRLKNWDSQFLSSTLKNSMWGLMDKATKFLLCVSGAWQVIRLYLSPQQAKRHLFILNSVCYIPITVKVKTDKVL